MILFGEMRDDELEREEDSDLGEVSNVLLTSQFQKRDSVKAPVKRELCLKLEALG